MIDPITVIVSSPPAPIAVIVDEPDPPIAVTVTAGPKGDKGDTGSAFPGAILRTAAEGPPVVVVPESIGQFCRVGDAAPYSWYQATSIDPIGWQEISQQGDPGLPGANAEIVVCANLAAYLALSPETQADGRWYVVPKTS